MRATMKIGVVLLAVLFLGGVVFAQDEEKPRKKKKLTKEEKKALKARMRLAAYGKKLFQQSSNFSSTNKGCNSCHTQGGDKDLRDKVTEENAAATREAITKCLENRMKMAENAFGKKKWEKNPKNMHALIAYLQTLKSRRRR